MAGAMRRAGGAAVAVAVLSGGLVTCGSAPAALAQTGAPEPTRASALELTARAGVAFPGCVGSCDGSFDPGASIAGGALYRSSPSWGFGLAGRVQRARWSAPFVDGLGASQTVSSMVTSGLVGFSSRYTTLPEMTVSPVAELTVGVAFQSETRADSSCNDGVNPGAELGLGGRARLPPIALLAMGFASIGVPFSLCGVSDGPPLTPFASLSFGFLVGATVDLGFGS